MLEFWIVVVFPIILGSLFITGISLLRRYALKDKKISTIQFLISLYGIITISYGLIYIMNWGFSSPLLLPGFWNAVIGGTLANFFIMFFHARAASLDKGEVSLTAPLQAMTTGLVTGVALLVGEFPSRIDVIGILFMVTGSYILLFEKAGKWYEYFGPLKRILLLFKIRHLSVDERNKTAVVCLSLGSAFMASIGLFFDGLYTRRGINMQGLTIALLVLVGLISIGYFIWYMVKPDTRHRKFSVGKKKMLIILAIAICWIVGIYLVQPTYKKTFIAYVGTLKRFSILLSVSLGHFLFHEGDFKKRVWAAILILIGVALISTDDLPLRVTAKLEMLGF